MKFWHAGFAVKDIDGAVTLWESFGYSLKQKFEKDDPAAHAALMEDDRGVGVELWQFTGNSPLNEYVGRHLAFKCEDAHKTAEQLKKHGFKEVIPFTKGVMVNYIFLSDECGTFFELAEVKEGKWRDD